MKCRKTYTSWEPSSWSGAWRGFWELQTRRVWWSILRTANTKSVVINFENCKHEECGDQFCRPSEIRMLSPQNTTNCHACLLPISGSHHTFFVLRFYPLPLMCLVVLSKANFSGEHFGLLCESDSTRVCY